MNFKAALVLKLLASGLILTCLTTTISVAQAEKSSDDNNSVKVWSITVKDSATCNQGPITITVNMDLIATNSSSQPFGRYTGTATSRSRSVNPSYSATAQSDVKTCKVDFEIYQPLAPLVSSDDKKQDEIDEYTGQGTLTVGNPTGTSTVTGPYVQASKTHTSAGKMPISFTLKGSVVHMVLASPQCSFQFQGELTQK